ncbi:hypothetical protein GCK32_016995 [Trichostrongylus colubriformis]|uniref:PABS domain-containing protein n=1 Tax=Trichostrongylus colubriformis TaxID=6319 RepID=A0AAN8FU04_TRICO
MSSLSLDATDSGKQVLAIGVGGGTVSMGLHDIKPYVNVTAVEIDELVVKIGFKWFGVKDSKYHHTVVQDGVSYLKESAVQGRKFDLIILDACTEFGCPAKQFQNMEIIKTFKKLLTWTGSLVIDIIPLPMSPEKALWLKAEQDL